MKRKLPERQFMQNDFGAVDGTGAWLPMSAEAPAGPVIWTPADVRRLDLALLRMYGVPLPVVEPMTAGPS